MAQEVRTDPLAPPLPPTGKIAYEEFLAWLDEDTAAEWVDGEVILMSPISGEHQDEGVFLLPLIQFFVDTHQLGVVRYEPFQMKTGPELPGRSPDILFVAKANLSRLTNTYLAGPADLVVEIVSPDSGARDRVAKFSEYEKGGVLEYWLIDPQRRQAEFYQLGENGVYAPMPVGDDGIFRSGVLPGLWLRVEWLWQPPPLLSVLKEWGLV
jgi:Uma2 family endonuclease